MLFDPNSIQLVSLFGYFEDAHGGIPRHIHIPASPSVQSELSEMLAVTLGKLGLPGGVPQLPLYSPAEKYSGEDACRIELAKEYLEPLREVYALQNLPSNANSLNDIEDLVYYYSVFRDNQQRRLVAFHLARRFKGMVKARLTVINGDVLTLLNKPVFQLDQDFEFLVDAGSCYILRPHGFDLIAQTKEQILAASANNAAAVQAQVAYLRIDEIVRFSATHSRSARLLAAIRGRPDLHLVDANLLQQACAHQGVVLQHINGQFGPGAGHEYDFLCVLDRRAYTAELIPNDVEKYEAASRTRRN